MALAYLLTVALSLAVLTAALRHRPAPTPPRTPTPTPAAVDPHIAAEVHVILTAAAQLAARLTTAA